MKKFLFMLIALAMTTTFLFAAPQAVVFDWGNVIGFNDRSVVVGFMCDSFHFAESEFETANLEKKQAVEEGKSEVDFWLGFAKKKGIQLPEDWAQQYTAVLKESVGADPDMYLLIDQLKKSGIRIGMLSNIDNRYTKLIRDFGFYKPFDPCLLSCEMGLAKPDSRAYSLLLKTIDLPANKIVFVDDKWENVEAAQKMGIDAIQFQSLQQLREELVKRKLLK